MRGIAHRELFGPQLLAHIGKDLRIRWPFDLQRAYDGFVDD